MQSSARKKNEGVRARLAIDRAGEGRVHVEHVIARAALVVCRAHPSHGERVDQRATLQLRYSTHTPTTGMYTLSLHDALPISVERPGARRVLAGERPRAVAVERVDARKAQR